MTGRFPRQFGKYVLLKPLAKGGMGEIYLAAGGDVGGFEKLCVIKKVITEKADRTKSNRFLDEAKVVLRLAHSALVNTFDVGEVASEFYIAMELVEGKDLREVWNRCVRTRQRIPLDVALHVVREVARALSYVHNYGELRLVHRDVAPPNMLLSYVGDVKLTDFGLARSVLKQEHTAPGVVFGRAAYLAPEQARGEMADARTDVYTLGIVLWELLTGQQYLQLGGLDPAAALALVRHPRLVPPSSRAPWITPALDQVTMLALAPDREKRFRSAEELRQALTTVIAEIAPTADSSRVAEFMRSIYGETMAEERAERERFLKEVIPEFRATMGRIRPTPPETLMGERGLLGMDAPANEVAPARAPAPSGDEPPTEGPTPLTDAEAKPAEGRAEEQKKEPKTPAPASPPVERMVAAAESSTAVFARRYRLSAPLLENAIESLYAATDLRSARTAVTLYVLRSLPDASAIPAWQETARAVAGVRHPHVASILDLGATEEGRPFIAYEVLSGNDLGSLLAREPRLPAASALRVALQITRALAAVHAVGVCHGWLRPATVFVPAAGHTVKIFGFGSVRLYGPGDRSDGIGSRFPVGVVEYLPPEQLRGSAPDVLSDIYGVGAVLYELLTGVPAHTGTREVLERKKKSPPQSPRLFRPDLPPEMEQLLSKLLDPDPQRRPGSADELEEMLLNLNRALGAPETEGAAQTDDQRRRARREAAFRVLNELMDGEAEDPAALRPAAPPPPIPAGAAARTRRPTGPVPVVAEGSAPAMAALHPSRSDAAGGPALRARSQPPPPPLEALAPPRASAVRPVTSTRPVLRPQTLTPPPQLPSVPMLFTSALGPAAATPALNLGASASGLGSAVLERYGVESSDGGRRRRRIIAFALILVGVGAAFSVMRLLSPAPVAPPPPPPAATAGL
jgi:serine/threonine protein kinase